MPRRPNPVPTYRLHKQSGQAIVTLRPPGCPRKDVLLGPYDSPESKAEYERVLAELRARPGAAVPCPDVTVNEVLLPFWRHAERHYRRADGTATKELGEYRSALRPVKDLYGHTPAAEFGPRKLVAVRQWMVGAGWCRSRINKQVGRVRRAFKWAAAQELLPAAVAAALGTVEGLQRGRTDAVERPPVGPAPDAHVEAVLPFLQPTVRSMLELQRLTGMRPGEVRLLRRADLDTTGPVWFYRPPTHKMAYAGRGRVVPLGPKAQAVLRLFLVADPLELVFTPARAREERFAAVRARRKSKVPPSQLNRRKPPGQLKKKVPLAFTDFGYAAVVRRACEKAGVPPWHPHQLRHAYATAVQKQFGVEAVRTALGHAHVKVSELYAERDLDLAARVAAAVG